MTIAEYFSKLTQVVGARDDAVIFKVTGQVADTYIFHDIKIAVGIAVAASMVACNRKWKREPAKTGNTEVLLKNFSKQFGICLTDGVVIQRHSRSTPKFVFL